MTNNMKFVIEPKTNTNPPKKIVLTGGPGVGKTSVLRYLSDLNYSVREEVFTKIFNKALEENRFNDDFLRSKELVHKLTLAQLELETQPTQNECLFLDRSLIDIWGFAKNMSIEVNFRDEKKLTTAKYDFVFILDPLPKHHYDQNTIRRQTFEESLKHHHSVLNRYKEFLKLTDQVSTPLVQVPFIELGSPSTVKERTDFILEKLAETFGHLLKKL